MVYEISVAVAVLIFAILAFFIIKTLISLRHTLCRVNHVAFEVEKKLNNFDSTLQSLSNIGDICENASEKFKLNYLERKVEKEHAQSLNSSGDFVEWIVLSVKLGEKLLNRRKL